MWLYILDAALSSGISLRDRTLPGCVWMFRDRTHPGCVWMFRESTLSRTHPAPGISLPLLPTYPASTNLFYSVGLFRKNPSTNPNTITTKTHTHHSLPSRACTNLVTHRYSTSISALL